MDNFYAQDKLISLLSDIVISSAGIRGKSEDYNLCKEYCSVIVAKIKNIGYTKNMEQCGHLTDGRMGTVLFLIKESINYFEVVKPLPDDFVEVAMRCIAGKSHIKLLESLDISKIIDGIDFSFLQCNIGKVISMICTLMINEERNYEDVDILHKRFCNKLHYVGFYPYSHDYIIGDLKDSVMVYLSYIYSMEWTSGNFYKLLCCIKDGIDCSEIKYFDCNTANVNETNSKDNIFRFNDISGNPVLEHLWILIPQECKESSDDVNDVMIRYLDEHLN